MRAITYEQYGAPDVLQMTEVDIEELKDHEVLINVHATTVTAVDCAFRQGVPFIARFFTGLKRPKQKILGSALSGVVAEVGSQVTRFKRGDNVFGVGPCTYAEYVRLAEEGVLVTKPEGISHEQAAAVPYGALTALPFLRDEAQLKRGMRIVINGASGAIGVYAIQMAKLFGAEVTAVCSTASIELVKALGADHVVDYTETDFIDTDVTYDIVFDVAGKRTYSQCKNMLSENGIFLTTVSSPSIMFNMLWTSMFGSKKAKLVLTGLRQESEVRKDMMVIKEWVEAEHIKPVIDTTYPFADIPKAHSYMESGHKKGSVVITVTSL